MAKQAYVYSGTDWVPLASEVTNLTAYQTKALAQAPYRNLLINGAMQVAQRGTSTASITTDNYFTADRWYFGASNMGTWTQTVENDAPSGSGFRNSLKVLCTTADASPAVGDNITINQRLEGQNLQAIKKGTAAAEQLTVSFWVKSNVTGTYIVDFYDNDNTRQVSKSYTISASATWEKKTITIPADTTGAFDNDNNLSLFVFFWLGAGTNFTSGTLNSSSWNSATNANRAVGQVNVAAAISNYWQVTGVQLEVGDTTTPFEFKPIDEELNQCYRYFETISSHGGVPAVCWTNTQAEVCYFWKTTKRATPTVTILAHTNWGLYFNGSGRTTSNNSVQLVNPYNGYIEFNATGLSGGGAGWVSSSATNALTISAEL